MRTHLIATALLTSAIALPAMGQGMKSSAMSGSSAGSDATFVKKAAISDMYEIQASQLAQTKAVSAEVKNFASKMVTDHSKTSDQLKSILSGKSSPKAPTAIDAKHKALLSKLKSVSGADFDSAYAQQQLEAHQQAVTLFTGESQGGNDADLKTFASQTLPALQQHLSMAQTLQKGGAKP